MAPPPSLSTILIDRVSPAVALISYNRPKIANAFDVSHYLNTAEALIWARDEPEVKVVIVTGKGKHYCAGKMLKSPDEGGDTIEQEIVAGGKLGAVLQNYPKILIAAVNGAAIGWQGCTQLFNFDLVYASTRAVFQTPFTSLGFAPEGGSSYTFPKIMGKHHANRLLIASDKLTAQEMYISGYVSQVLDEKDFVEQVCAIAKRIGSYDSEGLKAVKQLTSSEKELAERREAGQNEGKELARLLNRPEVKAKMSAFSGKSKTASIAGAPSKL